jgi:hypothetical protein
LREAQVFGWSVASSPILKVGRINSIVFSRVRFRGIKCERAILSAWAAFLPGDKSAANSSFIVPVVVLDTSRSSIDVLQRGQPQEGTRQVIPWDSTWYLMSCVEGIRESNYVTGLPIIGSGMEKWNR